MKQICVITGAGSGMGKAFAKTLGKQYHVVIVGRKAVKLEGVKAELEALGITATVFECDVSNKDQVKKLAAACAALGTVKVVINAAGVNPEMAKANDIFKINAIGTVNMDTEFAAVMNDGGCILNISSMAAYLLPPTDIPVPLYQIAMGDLNAFEYAGYEMLKQIPEDQQGGSAYSISKNFVVWYTEKAALMYGPKGIRVLSVAPGTIDTPMNDLISDVANPMAIAGPMGRIGTPEEVATLVEFLVSPSCSYITGTDILCDGGCIATIKAGMEQAAMQH